jgi:hypothetical protein
MGYTFAAAAAAGRITFLSMIVSHSVVIKVAMHVCVV